MKWQQVSFNLLRTLDFLSERPVNSTTLTFHSEFKKHQDFFLNVPKFEDAFNDIYPFELKARHELLNGTLFNDYYVRCVGSILDAKCAAATLSPAITSQFKRSTDASDT